MKNYKSARRLIANYRAVTLEQIEEKWSYYSNVGLRIALLAEDGVCPLCTEALKLAEGKADTDSHYCDFCIHPKATDRIACAAHETWKPLCYTESPEEALDAFKARADYLEQLTRRKIFGEGESLVRD